MTPKEKAYRLYETMFYTMAQSKLSPKENDSIAIKCALVAVDEITDAIYWHEFKTPNKELDYWTEVKKEINNLK